MEIIKYPSAEAVETAVCEDEPLLAVISFDGKRAIVSPVTESGEHHILLAQNGFHTTDIDRYFRIAFDRDGADWTFMCPPDYKGLVYDEERRTGAFYKDGYTAISDLLQEMGYIVSIRIPRRFSIRYKRLLKNQRLSDTDT